MIVLFSLASTFLTGWILKRINCELSLLATCIGSIATIFLFLGLVSVRLNTATYLQEREALQSTYDASRTVSEYERVAITKDIAKFNMDLAVDKYWNETLLFDWFVDDVVRETQFIK